jgi:hypothetical protein
MIENIGTNREDAVHMTGESTFAQLRHMDVNLPMKDNPYVIPDLEYEDLVLRRAYPWLYEMPVQPIASRPASIPERIIKKVRKWAS